MPDYIILVHGDKNQMRKLKGGLEAEMRKGWSTTHRPTIATPENGVKVKLRFRKSVVADVLGSVAAGISNAFAYTSSHGESMQGKEGRIPPTALLVSEHFTSKVIAAEELTQFSSFRFCNIWQRQLVPLPKGFSLPVLADPGGFTSSYLLQREVQLLNLAVSYLEEVFDDVEVELPEEKEEKVKIERTGSAISPPVKGGKIRVEGFVTLSVVRTDSSSSHSPSPHVDLAMLFSHVLVEWKASPLADTVADSAVGLLIQLFSTTSQLRLHQQPSLSRPLRTQNESKRRKKDLLPQPRTTAPITS